MPESHPTQTDVQTPFVCDCEEWQREACAGESYCANYEGKRYCVLHLPGKKDQNRFDVAVMRKLGQSDFNFRGVYFPADFNLAQFVFTSEAVFSEAMFAGEASFESVQFREKAFFVQTMFNAGTSFSNAKFDREAEFHHAQFNGAAYFSYVTFGGEAAFSMAAFAAEAGFSGAVFNRQAIFNSTTFGGHALFSSAEFKSVTFFEAAEFKAAASFYSGAFHADANFTRSVFGGQAAFSKSQLHSQAHFGGCRFKAEADFVEVRFIGPARFYEAAFDAADFTLAWFDGDASFSGVSFAAQALFRAATFNSDAYFASATFGGAAGFFLAQFKKSCHFTDAIFKDHTCFTGSTERQAFAEDIEVDLQFMRVEKPERLSFHTVKLRPHWFVNVDSRNYEFIDVEWMNDINWSRTYSPKTELKSLAGKVSAPHRLLSVTYRQLAVNAEENHRYAEASRLRYASMDTQRLEKSGGITPWKMNWWYWLASGYGESTIRAFWVFVLVISLFTFGYHKTDFDHAGKTQPADVSKQSLLHPLDLKDSFVYSLNVAILQKPEPKPSSFSAKLLVWLETVLGPAQAALLALAVRRRFMR